MQAERLVAELANQKDRLADRIIHGHGQLVFLPGCLQRLANLVFRAEKAVRGHRVVQALVGPEVVVVVDEISEPSLRLVQFLRQHPPPEFLAHGFPEALAFAHGLRMLGP